MTAIISYAANKTGLLLCVTNCFHWCSFTKLSAEDGRNEISGAFRLRTDVSRSKYL
jgi:hypothetical protein